MHARVRAWRRGLDGGTWYGAIALTSCIVLLLYTLHALDLHVHLVSYSYVIACNAITVLDMLWSMHKHCAIA